MSNYIVCHKKIIPAWTCVYVIKNAVKKIIVKNIIPTSRFCGRKKIPLPGLDPILWN
jgi:hypothetical protein